MHTRRKHEKTTVDKFLRGGEKILQRAPLPHAPSHLATGLNGIISHYPTAKSRMDAVSFFCGNRQIPQKISHLQLIGYGGH